MRLLGNIFGYLILPLSRYFKRIPMKVVVDNKIPYVKEAIERITDEVVFVPGQGFTPELIKDADALIIRTRTLCNRKLLEGSNVRFIATATIGYDHIDTEYCREAGITWTNAPGCNANSVNEYLLSALVLLMRKYRLKPENLLMGIVGAGNVGSRIAQSATKELGIHTLVNDPPRAEREGAEMFSSLEEIAEKCNIITFHTPLSTDGKHPTCHLANEAFFQSLRKKPVIINTSRGEVIDTNALLSAMDKKLVRDAIIDVWENEPRINPSLLERAFISTPHIAGYSADGKANATRMSLEALCNFFHIDASFEIVPPEAKSIKLPDNKEDLLLTVYDPTIDSNKLKADSTLFEQLRNNYPIRREMSAYR